MLVTEPRIVLTDTITLEMEEAIGGGLNAFNDEITGYADRKPLAVSTVAGVQLLVQSVAEQDDGATWTLFPAGSAVARHPAREQSRGDLFRRRRLRLLRDWLAAAAAEYGGAIHAYVLMTNHVHLLVTPGGPQSLPRTMQSLGRRTVRHINARYRRTATLWEGRYRAAPIDSEACFLACCRSIELNPVRARMVRHPRDHACTMRMRGVRWIRF
jgi:REP element-mobilizing transposase RayT